MAEQILVTGATGNIGRKVVTHLLAQGADPATVHALTVDPARAALPDGVQVHLGSVRRPATLPAALQGIQRLYLAPAPEQAEAVLRHAQEAGVQHVVDLSGGADTHWAEMRALVEAVGVPYTHLCPGEFMENAEVWMPQVETGLVEEAYPQARGALIAMDDIACLAARLLLDDVEAHSGQAYDITGPESLTRAEQITQLADALGRDVRIETVSHARQVEVLTPIMGEYAEWYVGLLVDLANGGGYPATPVLAEQLAPIGRTPTTFREWAAAYARDRDIATAFRAA